MVNRYGQGVRSGMRRMAIAVGLPLMTALLGTLVPNAEAQGQTVLKAAFYQPAGHPIVELAKESLAKI